MSPKKHKGEGGQAQSAAASRSGLKNDKAWRVALRVVHDIEGPNSKANNDITQSKGRKRDYRAVGEDGVKTSTIDDNVTPAIVIQTNDGDAYYMLGDFNHVRECIYLVVIFLAGVVSVSHEHCHIPQHHQHAVLAGDSCCRYTSTHRVGLTEGHCFQSIRDRCKAALSKASAGSSICSREQWHEEQLAFTEVEFEWYANPPD
eukprot:COSAG02_NODE_3437_length_6745_cov_3.078694_5_plen_202_part_00